MKDHINTLIIIVIILGLISVLDINGGFKKRNSDIVYLTAKSAVVLDLRKNKILYSKNKDLRIPPASTVKLMTAIVVIENSNLNKIITVGPKAANIEPSRAGLKSGIQYRVKDLLAACLMSSSNDACLVLAEGLSETEDAFVKLMNEKARKIGMENTYFVNSTGLPVSGQAKLASKKQEQYSTVYDLTQLMRYVATKPLIIELLNTKEKFIKGEDDRRIRLVNHNKMLWKRPGWIIGKTGYTIKSRHCFVGATIFKKKGIIFAILSAKKPWQDLSILVNHGLRCYNGSLYFMKKKL